MKQKPNIVIRESEKPLFVDLVETSPACDTGRIDGRSLFFLPKKGG